VRRRNASIEVVKIETRSTRSGAQQGSSMQRITSTPTIPVRYDRPSVARIADEHAEWSERRDAPPRFKNKFIHR